MAQAALASAEENKAATSEQILNETTNTSNDCNDTNDTNNTLNTNDTNDNEKKSPSLTLNQHHIQIEGWLLKKSRVLKKWRRRWMVLSGNTLYSYKQPQHKATATEIIDINNIVLITKHSNNKKKSFSIELDKKLTFTLAADTNTYCDLWLHELNKIINLNGSMLIMKESGLNGKILSFGCKHLRRNCSILCACCNKYYFCSYCHDSAESGFISGGHELERKNIIAMKCCSCGAEQAANKYCINAKCKQKMANYFCSKCKFWDNDPNHLLYHCDKCGVCRSGNIMDYIHCDKCGVCLSKLFFENHKCMEQSTKCDCPICGDYLHITDKPVTFWSGCGHAIHVKCMEEFLVYDTLCPICREPWIP